MVQPADKRLVTEAAGNTKYRTATPGIRLPGGWQAAVTSKLAGASSALVKVGIVGTSIDYGSYTSNPRTKSWPALVGAALQAKYGDGGSGFYGAAYSAPFATSRSLAAGAISAWNANDAYWTLTGTWAANQNYGPGAYYLSNSVAGSTITMKNVRGTTIKVWTISATGSNAAWTYSIDGATAVAVADGTGFAVQTTTITVGAGNHTVVLTQNENGKPFYVIGVGGYNATGVVMENFSFHGSRTIDYSLQDGTSTLGPGAWSGGTKNPSDVLVYALGANDANDGYSTGVTLTAQGTYNSGVLAVSAPLAAGTYLVDSEAVQVDYMSGSNAILSRRLTTTHANGAAVSAAVRNAGSYASNVADFLARARETNSSAPVLLLSPHIGTYNTYRSWSAYHERLAVLSEQFDAAFVSMWQAGRASWAYWNGLGYWGTSSTPGSTGTDPIHLSDAGAAAYAATILKAIG